VAANNTLREQLKSDLAMAKGKNVFLKFKELTMLTYSPKAPLIPPVEDNNNQPLLMKESFQETPEEDHLEIVGTLQEALRDSEQSFRSFVENLNGVLFVLTPSGLFSYVSPQWKEAFGYESSETIGQPFQAFIHPDDVPCCFAFLQQVMESGEKQSGIEYRVLCKDGTYLWYRANASAVKDPSNGTLTLVGIGRDITERKRAEDALRFSNVILSTIQETMVEGILAVDMENNFISWNKNFVDMWGIPLDIMNAKSDELALQSVLDMLVDPVLFLDGVRRLYADLTAICHDELTLKDGRIFERRTSPIIGSDNFRYGRVWYFLDITERKQYEYALTHSQSCNSRSKSLSGGYL